MGMVRVFLRTAPMALLLVACVTTPPPEQPPASAATYYELGRAYFEGGNFRLAIPEFSKAVELKPSDPIYRSDLGMAFMFNRTSTRRSSSSKKRSRLTNDIRRPRTIWPVPIC